jgi:hypothetical protein
MDKGIYLLHVDRDGCNGITYNPKEAILRIAMTLKLIKAFLQNRPDREE